MLKDRPLNKNKKQKTKTNETLKKILNTKQNVRKRCRLFV